MYAVDTVSRRSAGGRESGRAGLGVERSVTRRER